MKKPGFQESLTPYESWISTTESLNPAAFFKALRRGVMLSAVLAMKSMGELVFATKGPTSRSTKSVLAKGRIELTGKSPFRLHLPPRTAHSEEDVDSTSSFIWRIRCSEYFSNSSTVSFIPLPSVHMMALNASSVPSSSAGGSGGIPHASQSQLNDSPTPDKFRNGAPSPVSRAANVFARDGNRIIGRYKADDMKRFTQE